MDTMLILTIVGTAATVYCAWIAHKQMQAPLYRMPDPDPEDE